MKRFVLQYEFHGEAIIDADSEEAALDFFATDEVQEVIKHNPQKCRVSVADIHEDTSWVDPFEETDE